MSEMTMINFLDWTSLKALHGLRYPLPQAMLVSVVYAVASGRIEA